MPIAQDKLEDLLKHAFPKSQVTVTDTVGDADHYEVKVCSSQFKGKSLMEQHKMVHMALGSLLAGQLHAISIKTVATEEDSVNV